MAISDQAAGASRRGGTLAPDEEGVQVAGKVDVITDIIKAIRGEPASAAGGRVPTPGEERLMPNRNVGEQDPYVVRQQEQAPQMLSPAGQQRFEESGFNAADAINPPPTVDALDALGADEALAKSASQNLNRVDPETGLPRPGATEAGAADDMDAMGAIVNTAPEKVDDFVRGGADGIDFNFEQLQSGDDVKAMINQVSEIYADPIQAAKRGVVTQKETLEEAEQLLADEMGFTRRLLKRKRGAAFNAAEATASRILIQRSGERLTELATRIRDGETSPSVLLQFRRQMSIHAGIQMQTKGMQTEIARALNAFNIPASARTPELQADAAARLVQDTGGSAEAIKLAKGFLKAQTVGGNAAANKFAVGGWGSKANGVFEEVYINGMLSWTYTHVKNFVATPTFMAYQGIEEVIAGVYGGIERTAGRALGLKAEGSGFGSRAEGVYSGQAVARLYGQSRAIKDAWITAAETMKTGKPGDQFNKLEASQYKAIDAENLEISGPMGGFVDVLGKIIRLPGTALMAADDFWRVISQRGELYAHAYNAAQTAASLGKSTEEAVDNFAMTILDPRSMANQLEAGAQYNVLTSDAGMLGKLGSGIQNLHIGGFGVGKLLMPFAKAPTNAVMRWLERMVPTGLLKDPVKRQKALARISLSYGAMYMFAGYAQDGRLTGAMPREESQRNMLPPNWKPYSLVFRGDNWPVDAEGDPLPLYNKTTGVPNGALTYVSYAGLEPVGAILGIAATTVEMMRRSNDPRASGDYPAAAIAAASEYFREMPMIATIGDLVKALETGDPGRLLESPLKAALPYSAAIRAGERQLDSTVRRPSAELETITRADAQRMAEEAGTDVDYRLVGLPKSGQFFSEALQKWYSVTSDREIFGGASDETSAIQYDVFGEPREMNVRFDTNPVTAVYNAIMPFNIRHGEAPTTLQGEQIRLQGPLRTAKEKEKGFRFSEAFQSEWTRQAKREIMTMNPKTRTGQTYMGALNALIESTDYWSMKPQEQHDALRDIEDRFYDAALDVVFAQERYLEVGEAFREYEYTREEMKAQGTLR